MFYNIIKSIFPSLKNTIISTLILTSSLVAYAGVYKNGTRDAFNGIVESSNNVSELIAVGDLGMIYTRALGNNAVWAEQSTGLMTRLLDVASAPSFDDVVVGEMGTILTRRGGVASWSAETSNTLVTLRKALIDPNNGNNIIVGDSGTILFYDKITSAWLPQASGTAEDLTAIVSTSNPTRYLAISDKGTVITSSDAQAWTIETATSMGGKDAIYYTTAANVGRYLSVGGYGLFESSDGINGSVLKALGTQSQPYSLLNGVSYSAATNTITVVGDNGLNLSSTDDGVSWTGTYGSYTIPAPRSNYDSVYTARYNNIVVGSYSGINNIGQNINDIYFNTATGLYVAVGNRATIITSTDAQTWNNSTFAPVALDDVYAIDFDGTNYLAITGIKSAGSEKGNFLSSTNGVDWTSLDLVTGGAVLRDIAFNSTDNIYVIISDSYVWTSGDRSIWAKSALPLTSVNAVVYSATDNQFVAVGGNKIVTSPDGVTWTSQAMGSVAGVQRLLNGVMYNASASLYVAVGEQSSKVLVMTSPDGVNWTEGTYTSVTSGRLSDVTYDTDQGQYIAVAGGSGFVSNDGVEWTYVYNSTATTRLQSVAYDNVNKQVVAVGELAITIFTPQMVAPVFTPANAEVRIESTSLYMTITSDLAGLSVTDYSGKKIIPTLTSTAPNSRPYTMGPYTLSWQAIDYSGNVATFNQPVVIEDTTVPVLTLTGAQSETLEAGSVYTDPGATVTDTVDSAIGGVGIGVIVGGNYVGTSNVGTFTITYNATDSSNNNATEVIRTITVVDTVVPTISTSDISVYTTGALTLLTSQQLGQPVVVDATSIALTNDAPVSGFPVGATTVTWTATDAADNQATSAQIVTILADNVVPQITLNGLATVTVQYGSTYTDSGASVSDDVDTNISLIIVNSVNTSLVGSYTVTYNATDYSSNQAVQVTRTVNVVDQQTPVVTLVGSAVMNLANGATFSDPGATVTDNVDSNLSISVSGSVNTLVQGNYTLTYSATDTAGNQGSVSRTVNVAAPVVVADTEAPVITAPSPLVITSLDGNGIAYDDSRIQAFLSGVSATDNVGVVGIGPKGGFPGTFPVGITPIIFEAFDAAGNSSTASSSVTIVAVDTSAPVITVAQSVSVSSADGNGIALSNSDIQAYLSSVQVVDDSGVFTLTVSALPDTLPIGTTSVTFTAVDEAGNEAQATGSIIIVDDSPPANNGSAGSTSGGSSGGGSMSWFMFLIAGLAFLTRRLKTHS